MPSEITKTSVRPDWVLWSMARREEGLEGVHQMNPEKYANQLIQMLIKYGLM